MQVKDENLCYRENSNKAKKVKSSSKYFFSSNFLLYFDHHSHDATQIFFSLLPHKLLLKYLEKKQKQNIESCEFGCHVSINTTQSMIVVSEDQLLWLYIRDTIFVLFSLSLSTFPTNLSPLQTYKHTSLLLHPIPTLLPKGNISPLTYKQREYHSHNHPTIFLVLYFI